MVKKLKKRERELFNDRQSVVLLLIVNNIGRRRCLRMIIAALLGHCSPSLLVVVAGRFTGRLGDTPEALGEGHLAHLIFDHPHYVAVMSLWRNGCHKTVRTIEPFILPAFVADHERLSCP